MEMPTMNSVPPLIVADQGIRIDEKWARALARKLDRLGRASSDVALIAA
jgi:hypothetical protein